MSKRKKIIVAVMIGVLALAGIVIYQSKWHKNRSLAISKKSQFRIQIPARPHAKPGLKTIAVDLSIKQQNEPCDVVFRLRRASLGSIDETYRWDGKADVSFAQTNISFVDFTRLVRVDGVITAWDVKMAEQGKLRLKVWRDLGAFWQVTAQSDVVMPTSGLNHIELNPSLPVKQGDYIGLYTEKIKVFKLVSPINFGLPVYLTNQKDLSLAENARRMLEVSFRGDVKFEDKAGAIFPGLNPNYAYKVYFSSAPVHDSIGSLTEHGKDGGAVHPLTLVDMTKVAPRDGKLVAWEAVATGQGETKLKIWRRNGDKWAIVGQSRLEKIGMGLNKFVLDPPLSIHKGDYLGYFTGNKAQEFSCQKYIVATNAGKQYVNSDFDGEILDSQMIRDPAGNYSFRALYAPDEPQGELMASLNLKSGRSTYRFELPDMDFASDEQLEFSIEPVGNANVFIYPRLRNFLGKGGKYVGLEYNKEAAVTAARVVAGKSMRWPINEAILFVISGLGLGFTLFPRPSRRRLMLIALVPFASAVVWMQLVSAAPLSQLLPAVVVMFILPGYVILELFFPSLAKSLSVFERPPLLFSLSVGVWTLIGLPAYRLQWASDAVISAILAATFFGVIGVLIIKRKTESDHQSQEDAITFPNARFYYSVLIIMLGLLALVVGYCAQFQMPASDTISHMASYRKIADGVKIIGGNALLGPGMTWDAHYASNPWYLAFGLTARQAHVEVGWLYVFLCAVMTPLVFLSLLFLLKTVVNDTRISILGTLLTIGPFIYEHTMTWRSLTSHYLEFLAYPYTLAELILFPLLTAVGIRYILFRGTGWWVFTILLTLAVTGVHLLFVVWTPLLICGMLTISLLFKNNRFHWKPTIALIIAIGIVLLVVGYCTAYFSLARHVFAPMTVAELNKWLVTKGMFQIKPTWFIATPFSKLFYSAGSLILSLAIIGFFGSYRAVCTGGENKIAWLPGFKLEKRRSNAWNVVVLTAFLFILVWFVVYNPLLVRWGCQIFNATPPIYRLPDTVSMLGQAIKFGALACLLGLVFNNRHEWRWRLLACLPVIAVVASIFLPLRHESLISAMVNPIVNAGWFPSVLDLPNDALYRAMSRLSPGVVAVRPSSGQLVAAFTPHYLMADPRILASGDLERRMEGVTDCRCVVTFGSSPENIRALLAKYNCRYVIVTVNERKLPNFYEQTNLFAEVMRSETDVIFQTR